MPMVDIPHQFSGTIQEAELQLLLGLPEQKQPVLPQFDQIGIGGALPGWLSSKDVIQRSSVADWVKFCAGVLVTKMFRTPPKALSSFCATEQPATR